MRIVQSFWSKPCMLSESLWFDARLNGGWPHRVFNYYSWALSCLQLRRYYNAVELVTDQLGKEIFIDKLKLPYTSVDVSLNEIDHYNPGLWALGKLYTYSLQKSPFLHVDGDVFIWEKFDDQLINAGLIVQNMEASPVDFDGYREVWERLTEVPGYFRDVSRITSIPGVSAGILGGSDISFFQSYVKEAFLFLEKNMDVINNSLVALNAGFVNVISEQILFEALARHRERAITCLFPQIDAPEEIGLFHAAKRNKNYVHCFGFYKLSRMAYACLEWKLKTNYPEYYRRINELVSTSEI